MRTYHSQPQVLTKLQHSFSKSKILTQEQKGSYINKDTKKSLPDEVNKSCLKPHIGKTFENWSRSSTIAKSTWNHNAARKENLKIKVREILLWHTSLPHGREPHLWCKIICNLAGLDGKRCDWIHPDQLLNKPNIWLPQHKSKLVNVCANGYNKQRGPHANSGPGTGLLQPLRHQQAHLCRSRGHGKLTAMESRQHRTKGY